MADFPQGHFIDVRAAEAHAYTITERAALGLVFWIAEASPSGREVDVTHCKDVIASEVGAVHHVTAFWGRLINCEAIARYDREPAGSIERLDCDAMHEHRTRCSVVRGRVPQDVQRGEKGGFKAATEVTHRHSGSGCEDVCIWREVAGACVAAEKVAGVHQGLAAEGSAPEK